MHNRLLGLIGLIVLFLLVGWAAVQISRQGTPEAAQPPLQPTSTSVATPLSPTTTSTRETTPLPPRSTSGSSSDEASTPLGVVVMIRSVSQDLASDTLLLKLVTSDEALVDTYQVSAWDMCNNTLLLDRYAVQPPLIDNLIRIPFSAFRGGHPERPLKVQITAIGQDGQPLSIDEQHPAIECPAPSPSS